MIEKILIKDDYEDDYGGDYNDWRESAVAEFKKWLDELTEEEYKSFQCDNLVIEDTPDLFSLFSELIALKREVQLQTRASQKIAGTLEENLCSMRRDLNNQSENLENTAMDLKSQIPDARREAQLVVINELLNIRESIENGIKVSLKYYLPNRPWLRNANKILGKIITGQEMLLNKVDDSMRRLNIVKTAEPGDEFNAKIMNAIAVSQNSDASSNTVIEVIRQGYIKDNKLLRLAEVKVEK